MNHKPAEGRRIHVTGVVQGVGFRPFVYGLARRLQLTGWVRNTSAGVDIVVDGHPLSLDSFAAALRSEAPPLAQIEAIEVSKREADGFGAFEIIPSRSLPGAFQPISPDVTVCADCLRELFDPYDRRYRYPFINCTNCGPRFTIIKDVPYDRPQTTMAPFPMCDECAAEYHDPLDRRFHAQPVACPHCGPHVWLEEGQRGKAQTAGTNRPSRLTLAGPNPPSRSHRAIRQARELLKSGHIVAVKGLGGFHLACDATDEAAVAELRRRKLRVDKPFAVMMADVDTVRRHCLLDEEEQALLQSARRPIVILQRRRDTSPSARALAPSLAPGQNTVGVMLPYTPLHALLLERAAGFPEALVMTSGNLSEEPIAMENEEARQRLGNLADAFLMHNRDIHVRCDDSVARAVTVEETGNNRSNSRAGAARPQSGYLLRRSRGYAPDALHLPHGGPSLLATGAELKNTFCLTRRHYAFLSQYVGDLQNYETLHAFQENVNHFQRLFHVQPQALAFDLHPDYLATRYALQRAQEERLPAVGVQHHHAHVAACMAEHGLSGERPLIGVALDGTGYGRDPQTGEAAIWGGEFLIADYESYRRAAHLAYVPLPGGDKAIREPWRMALAWLHQAGIPWEEDLPPVRYALNAHKEHNCAGGRSELLPILRRQLQTGLNAPPTSSMGRLFDAVAALTGVRQVVNYEAQAAVELEALADPAENGRYEWDVRDGIIDPTPLLAAVISDLRADIPTPTIGARFHNSVAAVILDVCRTLRAQTGLNEVALSGGVWQNAFLLARSVALLQKDQFTVYVHHRLPPNDGGLALGQAAVALCKLDA